MISQVLSTHTGKISLQVLLVCLPHWARFFWIQVKHFAKDHWQDRLQPSPVPQLRAPATVPQICMLQRQETASVTRNHLRPQAPQIAISKAVRWRAKSWVVQGPSQRLQHCTGAAWVFPEAWSHKSIQFYHLYCADLHSEWLMIRACVATCSSNQSSLYHFIPHIFVWGYCFWFCTRPASVPPPPPPLWHNFVTRHLSHTTLSHTIFHTQLCHTPSFTHHFVTHHLLHHTQLCHTHNDNLSHNYFVTHNFCHIQLCHVQLFVIYNLSHATLSHTPFHTHTTLSHTLFHTLFFTHNFVTHSFHTPSFHTPSLSHILFHTTLEDIYLRLAWQAWQWLILLHLAGSGGALGHRWSPLVAQGAAPLCVASVALLDIHLSFHVAGVALGDIYLRLAWQAWHLLILLHLAGSGGALGRRWSPWGAAPLVAIGDIHSASESISLKYIQIRLCQTTTLSRTIFHTYLSHMQLYRTQLCHTQIFRTPTFPHTSPSHTTFLPTTLSHTIFSHTSLSHLSHATLPSHLCHTQFCHTQLCHAQFFHTQLCHRQSFTHNFVTQPFTYNF